MTTTHATMTDTTTMKTTTAAIMAATTATTTTTDSSSDNDNDNGMNNKQKRGNESLAPFRANLFGNRLGAASLRVCSRVRTMTVRTFGLAPCRPSEQAPFLMSCFGG